MNNVLQRIMNKVHYKFPLTEQKVVRSLVARKMTRDWLNSRYQSYSLREKERFYLYYSKIFRDHDRAIAPGSWLIEFAGKSIVLPLCGDQAWLEWDLAVAACGHDLKIKMSYETLIRAAAGAILRYRGELRASFAVVPRPWHPDRVPRTQPSLSRLLPAPAN